MFPFLHAAVFAYAAGTSQTETAHPQPTELLQQLRSADGAETREALNKLARISTTVLTHQQRRDLVAAANDAAGRLLRDRVRPTDDGRFTVWGSARDGGNNTLQRDLRDYADDAERVRQIAKNLGDAEAARQTAVQNRELLDKYHRYITARWSISPNTERLFAEADNRLVAIANPYLEKVDAAISDAVLRTVIRQIQPACVRINRASGVNIAADGLVLTNAHVAWRKGQTMTAEFPDGRKFDAKCIAIDTKFDLALCRLEKADHLPTVHMAANAPRTGDRVICIGQPGTYTPSGERTNYQPFHVSVGSIRGLRGEPLDEQSPLGGTKHDAWTYWGHSGSPLFNESGEVVALHNSWDSATATRHAVTHAAIVSFLKENLHQ